MAHEYAHAVAAYRQGDDTAYMLGRITLNPLPHIDPIMSIAFPAISCGVYGYPLAGAVAIAVREVRTGVAADPVLERVIFACFGSTVREAYEHALEATDSNG